MKKTAPLLLLFSLCDVGFTESDDELYQCLGSTSSRMAQNLGAMGEKVTNMVEKHNTSGG